jgi:tRNA(Ile)-lysidine synthase
MIPHISQGAFDDLTEWLGTDLPNSQLDVGGGTVVKKVYNDLVITDNFNLETTQINYELELSIGDEVMLPDGRMLILRKNYEKRGTNGTFLCYNSLCVPLRVRNRIAGDRVGTVKVKKLMIDAKITLADRDSWPVIVDANDVVIWVPGLKKSSVCIPKQNNENDLWIEIRQ